MQFHSKHRDQEIQVRKVSGNMNDNKKILVAKKAINKLLTSKNGVNSTEMLSIISLFKTRKTADYPISDMDRSWGIIQFKLNNSIYPGISIGYSAGFSADIVFTLSGLKVYTNYPENYWERGEHFREKEYLHIHMDKEDINELLLGHSGSNRYALTIDKSFGLKIIPEWKEKIVWDWNDENYGKVISYDRYNYWETINLNDSKTITRFNFELVKGGYYYHYYDIDDRRQMSWTR